MSARSDDSKGQAQGASSPVQRFVADPSERAGAAELHLAKLVAWGHGTDAPDDCKRAWHEARLFLASLYASSSGSSSNGDPQQ